METAVGKTIRFGASKKLKVLSEEILADNANYYSKVIMEGGHRKKYIGFRRHDNSYKRA